MFCYLQRVESTYLERVSVTNMSDGMITLLIIGGALILLLWFTIAEHRIDSLSKVSNHNPDKPANTPKTVSSTPVKSNTEEKSKKSNAVHMLNLDNDYFLVKDGRLLEYRGKEDSFFVPRGVRIIGGNDNPISAKTIDTIYISNTVYVISDVAPPCVESIYYEGPEDRSHYDKEWNFHTNGWIADWSKTNKYPHRVYEVKFHFNYQHYAQIEAAHYERNPKELQRRMRQI